MALRQRFDVKFKERVLKYCHAEENSGATRLAEWSEWGNSEDK